MRQTPIYTENGLAISNYKANIKHSDNQTLGVITDRYRTVQNQEAFAFPDALLGKGIK